MPLSVWTLVCAQSLSMCTAPLVILIGGLVGTQLAPDPRLATLPVALIVVGTVASIFPATRSMQRLGRKPVFLIGALLCSVSAMAAALSLNADSFTGFCLACCGLGSSLAIAQQYRFAAMEAVPAGRAGPAASRVLLGGLVAALLGPELTTFGAKLAPLIPWTATTHFAVEATAFLLLCGLALIAGTILLLGYRDYVPVAQGLSPDTRPLRAIFSNRGLWLATGAAAMGYAMMSLVMTATPVNMHHVDGHTLGDTKWVIQSHLLAMFIPSFFSGQLIARWGAPRLMGLGLVAYLATIGAGLMGQHLMHYWFALVLLGIGWNFLFVGGTTLLPQCHRPEERFRVQSINDLLVFGMQASAALASGWIVVALGWQTLLLLCLTMVAAIAVLLTAYRRRQPANA